MVPCDPRQFSYFFPFAYRPPQDKRGKTTHPILPSILADVFGGPSSCTLGWVAAALLTGFALFPGMERTRRLSIFEGEHSPSRPDLLNSVP